MAFPSNKKAFFWLIGLILLVLIFFFFFSAPGDFPAGAIVKIPEGANLRSVSRLLVTEHIIRSPVLFEAFVMIYGGEKHIIPTDYLFEESTPVFEVARRISRGDRHLAPISVTIPEGWNTDEMADAFSAKLPNFDKVKFKAAASAKEGYLFPDTYFFFPDDNEEEAIRLMTENFEKKVEPVRADIIRTGHSEKEIIIMASLIEREAEGDGDRKYISGILWRRIKLGIALQADAAPETYKSRGLPKRPLGNPGLLAIQAAIHPEISDYLYYLHDKEGGIHYAKTFEEHKRNKMLYLSNAGQ